MDNKSVQIYVALKHMGNVTKRVKEYPFLLSETPTTLGELIEEAVKSCIAEYNRRGDHSNHHNPLTEEQFNDMREIGKFAFGVHYNDNIIDEEKAIQTAKEALTDGLVRVFLGNEELTDLNEKITISDGNVFTFVRLTMLSGRMW